MADISQVQIGNTIYNIKDVEARKAAGNMLTGTLTTGETSLVIENSVIKSTSMIDIYTSNYGLSPSSVETVDGQIILTFKAQQEDIDIRVVVIGGE